MNTAMTQPAVASASPNSAMPASRILRAYAMEAKYETLRMLRAPAFAGPFLLLPVVLYLLFAGVAFKEPSYLELWSSLPADSDVEEVVRNFFIRQPLLWFE